MYLNKGKQKIKKNQRKDSRKHQNTWDFRPPLASSWRALLRAWPSWPQCLPAARPATQKQNTGTRPPERSCGTPSMAKCWEFLGCGFRLSQLAHGWQSNGRSRIVSDRLGYESFSPNSSRSSAKLPGSFLTRFLSPSFFASFFTRRLCSRILFWMLYLGTIRSWANGMQGTNTLRAAAFLAEVLQAQLLLLAFPVALQRLKQQHIRQAQHQHDRVDCARVGPPATSSIVLGRSHTQAARDGLRAQERRGACHIPNAGIRAASTPKTKEPHSPQPFGSQSPIAAA